MTPRFSRPNPDTGTILLTGASGFLGGELLRRVLDQTDREVVAVVRRPLDVEHERLHLLFADLTDDAPLPLPEQASDITTVIHCAASVSFTLPLDEQREINVEGTRRVLELAAKLPNLERVQHVSTAYVAGMHEGEFGPDDLDRGQQFRNTYEQTKNEAEKLAWDSGLPVQIIRPSIVVGDQRTGYTAAFNVLYPPMKAYALNKLSVAPGREEAPVDVVPIDCVADGMLALLDVAPGRTHIIAACENATTVGELVDLGAERFQRSRGAVIPEEELRRIISELPEEQRIKAEEGLERAASVIPYFDVRAEYRDPETKAFLAERGIVVPKLRDYFDTLMDYAVENNWGKVPQAAAA